MKKLVYGAAALTLAGSAFAQDTDWSAFSQDVQSLTTSLAADKEGPTIGGFLQSIYTFDSDEDISAFSILQARIEITGGREGYSYKVGYEATSNTLLDAFFVIPVSSISAKFGRFRPAIVRNALLDNSNRFFIDRSALGSAFEGRQDGIAISGEFDQLGWWISVTNGNDNFADVNGVPSPDTDDYLIAVRVALDIVGGGISDGVEGAYGGAEEIGAQIAASYYNDTFLDDSDNFTVEGHIVSSVYSFGVEFTDFDDQGALAQTGAVTPVVGGVLLESDSTPLTLYGTYVIVPDQWEVGVRFQDYDNSFDTNTFEFGVVNYLDGHNLKWGFGYKTLDSDSVNGVQGVDTDIFQLQLSMRF